MKKNILFLLLSCLLLTGCLNDKGKITVKFNCNGIVKDYKVKNGSVFKCSLFATDYEMKIVKIEDDKFTIESNNPLSLIDEKDRADANSTDTIFEIYKGKKNFLAVPLDGLLYTIEFEW